MYSNALQANFYMYHGGEGWMEKKNLWILIRLLWEQSDLDSYCLLCRGPNYISRQNSNDKSWMAGKGIRIIYKFQKTFVILLFKSYSAFSVEYGNVLKLWPPVACQIDPDKQDRPRSDCFWRSILIRVFPVCYCDMHFVSCSSDNQHSFENRMGKVYEILEHLQ